MDEPKVTHETDPKLENVLEGTRDLSDFCLRWPDLKAAFENETVDASPAALAAIRWLTVLADAVCVDYADKAP